MNTFFLIKLMLVASVAGGRINPKYAKNITVYHVNEANYTGIANMDTGDAAGDAFFSLRSVYIPIECADKTSGSLLPAADCNNPEIVGDTLTVSEVVVEMDIRFGNYSECNVCTNSTVPLSLKKEKCTDGDYTCVCGPVLQWHVGCPPTVGIESPAAVYGLLPYQPKLTNYEWWTVNMLDHVDGKWYSTPADGECDDTDKPCYWRVVENRRQVSQECQSDYLFKEITKLNRNCFNACPQPGNTTTTCVIECFYETLLGHGSDKARVTTGGMSQDAIVKLWQYPVTNDETKGGCPDYKPK